jgi:hypothetical protein
MVISGKIFRFDVMLEVMAVESIATKFVRVVVVGSGSCTVCYVEKGAMSYDFCDLQA